MSNTNNGAEYIKEYLLDYQVNREISTKLLNLIEHILKKVNHKSSDVKDEVLNFFIINIYKSLKSALILLDNDLGVDFIVICRRIIEAYIRLKYIAKNKIYVSYYREKYAFRANCLFYLINSHRPKDYIYSTLWINRWKIIDENIKYNNDLNKKIVSKIDNVEEMAKNVNLIYLYNNIYRKWSNICHCNMSTEATVRSNFRGELRYFIDHNTPVLNKNRAYHLNIINHCIKEIIDLYCNELALTEQVLTDFCNNIYFSFDLVTGKFNKISDIYNDLMSVSDDLKYELDEVFYQTDPHVFKRSGKANELKNLVEKIEQENKTL